MEVSWKKAFRMRKRDYITILVILLSVIVLFVIWKMHYMTKGETIVIAIDNKIIYETNLNNQRWVIIDNGGAVEVESLEIATERLNNSDSVTNVLIISDGKADMIGANCPDKICVDMNTISNIGESIVCMPNKLYVTVK